jgi:tetratricopeptide (TPR) repeat protein
VTAILLLAATVPAPPVAARADEARRAGRLIEAEKLYRQGVAGSPAWADGWWALGTINYGLERPGPCIAAFQRYLALDAKSATGLAFLGLCQFQAGQLPASLRTLEKAFDRGLPSGDSLTAEAMVHLAMLHTRSSNFERALQIATVMHREKERPEAIALAGIAALRRAIFPQEMASNDRELVFKMGRAILLAADRHAAAAGELFAELAAAYPTTPNVNFAYGSFLLATDPDRGIAELRKELALDPNHLPALVTLAGELLKLGDVEAARQPAAHAAKIAPGNFPARAIHGRVLVETGEVPAGVVELETAMKLAPDSPQVRFYLAAAYAKAGRKEDAARERAAFLKLKQQTKSIVAPEAK